MESLIASGAFRRWGKGPSHTGCDGSFDRQSSIGKAPRRGACSSRGLPLRGGCAIFDCACRERSERPYPRGGVVTSVAQPATEHSSVAWEFPAGNSIACQENAMRSPSSSKRSPSPPNRDADGCQRGGQKQSPRHGIISHHGQETISEGSPRLLHTCILCRFPLPDACNRPTAKRHLSLVQGRTLPVIHITENARMQSGNWTPDRRIASAILQPARRAGRCLGVRCRKLRGDAGECYVFP